MLATAALAAETIEPGFFLEHAYFVPLIMAASFLLTLAIGKRLGKHASWIGIVAIGACFLFAIVANVQWNTYVHDSEHAAEVEAESHADEGDAHADETDTPTTPRPTTTATRPRPTTTPTSRPRPTSTHSGDAVGPTVDGETAAARAPPTVAAEEEGAEHAREFEVVPVTQTWTWWTNGTVEFQAGMLLDGMAVMMLFVVTLISLLVHVFSTDYVAGDRRYTHYFAFLSLFSASMLGFVMAAEHPAAHHHVGAGRRVLLRAHRPLVGGEAQLRRRPQGLPHQPRRRRRPAGRHDHPVLRRRPDLRHRRDQHAGQRGRHHPHRAAGRQPAASSPRSCRSRASSSSTPGCPTPWPAPRRSRR